MDTYTSMSGKLFSTIFDLWKQKKISVEEKKYLKGSYSKLFSIQYKDSLICISL